jgi:LmbE family N-acetylglucosaminyl deacetylase
LSPQDTANEHLCQQCWREIGLELSSVPLNNKVSKNRHHQILRQPGICFCLLHNFGTDPKRLLGSGGLIQRALGAGKQVYVLYFTTGDGNIDSVRRFLHSPLIPQSFIRLGHIRYNEAVKAGVSLGIPRNHLFFLAFPDGAMMKIAHSILPDKVVRSQFTHFTRAAYPFAFAANAPYSKKAAVNLIRTVLNRIKPKTIILNLVNDISTDHKAIRLLTLDALRRSGLKPTLLSYLIHFPLWSKKGKFELPAQLLSARIRQLTLSDAEYKRKRRAFALHLSQFSISPYNRRLNRPNEFFWIGSSPV